MAQVYSDAALSPRAAPPRAGQQDAAAAAWAAEAQYLHRQLLGSAAPLALQQAYAQAHRLHALQGEPCCLARVMQRRLDVEAVELALRARQPALTRKVQWVLTLAELHGDVHEGAGMHPLRALWRLAWVALGAAVQHCKGRWLVWRHGLVRHV